MRFYNLAAAVLVATPALAGGLFTEDRQISGDIGAQINGSILSGEGVPQSKTANEALQEWERQLSKPLPIVPLSAPNAQTTFETLLNSKTAQDLQLEQSLEEQFGLPVSNICLTSVGACQVDYTTSGSTCFCGEQGAFDLGVVQ